MLGKDTRCLIVAKDTPTTLGLVEHVVMRLQSDVALVDTIEDARSLLAAEAFDIILAERELADGTGLDLLNGEEKPGTPLVLLDDRRHAETILQAFRRGAADVFHQPIDLKCFGERIRSVVGQHRTDRREAARQERLRRLSSRLIKDRRELRKRVDLICRDLVTAYQRLAEKVVLPADSLLSNESSEKRGDA